MEGAGRVSRRKLTPEEQDLWRRVARTTERLHPDNKSWDQPAPDVKKAIQRPKPAMQDFRPESVAPAKPSKTQLIKPLSSHIARLPVAMDQKAFGKLRRGKLTPEARLDLHGMTLAQAHPALIGFILRAQGQGKRLVLVITGKGKTRQDEGPIPLRRGVLRHAVPQWLRAAPLGPSVLQISEAHVKHGGSGALYVYLRRPR